MKYNFDFCRPKDNGTAIEYAPVTLAPNPGIPTEAEYNAAGWFMLDIDPPNPPAGKMVGATTFKIENNKVVAEYEYVDEPPKVRTFSKLKILAALIQAEVWPQVKTFIQEAGLYDLYLAAQDFKEDNEYFTEGKTALQSLLGWTDEQVEAILAGATINE